MNRKYTIIFRTCDKVNAVHGSPRPFDFTKINLIKKCFISLFNALQGYDFTIYIVADDISNDLKHFFLNYNIHLIEGVYGNDNSLRACFSLASKISDDEFIYFCEDDYLHTPDSFQKIDTFIKEYESITPGVIKWSYLLRKRQITFFKIKTFFKKPNFVIFPCDYPDRYEQKYLNKNYIFTTSNLHWRQIEDITFTFLIKASAFKSKYKIFNKSAKNANDRFLSKMLLGRTFFFKKLLGVSPIPSLSCHMHKETMSKVVDWEKTCNSINE